MTGEDNIWIVKPAALTHSKGMTVGNNLDLGLKLGENVVGVSDRAVAAKYIGDTMKFRGRKFDMRWVLVVQSFEPLKVVLYKHFWVRIAKKELTLDKRRYCIFFCFYRFFIEGKL